MNELTLFNNKFEIPLTVNKPEEVFDNINNYDNNPLFIDSNLIKDVYLPVHNDDGGSGRNFLYPYNYEDYIMLIKRILNYKPVVITVPAGHPAIIEKYYKVGVKMFMVSNWDDEYDALKNKYKDLQIFRSIVGNAYNEDIDYRFDSIVVPYKKLLDLEWIKDKSKQIPLIAIINHYCRENCVNLDNHPALITKHHANLNEAIVPTCPPGRSLFIPRQIVLKLCEYISCFKLVDRLRYCFDYEKFIRYYVYGEMLNEGELGTNIDMINIFHRSTIIHKLYEHSNLPSMNCQFRCATCDKKCY